MRVYTKTGDQGTTMTYQGKRVSKDHPLIKVVSKVDSLQASLDLAYLKSSHKKDLDKLQDKLWQLAGELSKGEISGKIKDSINDEDIVELESFIDKNQPELKYFVRFRKESSARLNEARIKCRELEVLLTDMLRKNCLREVVYKYINRLSDYLYVLSCIEEKKLKEQK
ncbi:MAG: ATP:cob(I)alamin adenosyltransferase [Candidatus Woesearchaeota archaeon]